MNPFKFYTIFHEIPKMGDYIVDEVNVPFIVGPDRFKDFDSDYGDLPATYASERCQYEVWKRIQEWGTPAEFLGFQSYRRRFKLPLPTPPFHFDVAIAERMKFRGNMTIGEQFKSCHPWEAWDVLEEALKATTDDPMTGLDSLFLAPFCHWIIRYDHFCRFMYFWWVICQYMEPRIEVPAKGYQSRLFSFLSDRIFTIWLHRNPCLQVIDLPYDFFPHGGQIWNEQTAV